MNTQNTDNKNSGPNHNNAGSQTGPKSVRAYQRRKPGRKPNNYQPEPEPAAIDRPVFATTEAYVQDLSLVGCTAPEIASLVGMSERDLYRKYGSLIRKGNDQLRVSLRRWQVRKARSGNVVMLIWLGKQLLGQKDKHEITRLDDADRDLINSRTRESLAFYQSLSDNLESVYGIGLTRDQIIEVVLNGFSQQLRPTVLATIEDLLPPDQPEPASQQLALQPGSAPDEPETPTSYDDLTENDGDAWHR